MFEETIFESILSPYLSAWGPVLGAKGPFSSPEDVELFAKCIPLLSDLLSCSVCRAFVAALPAYTKGTPKDSSTVKLSCKGCFDSCDEQGSWEENPAVSLLIQSHGQNSLRFLQSPELQASFLRATESRGSNLEETSLIKVLLLLKKAATPYFVRRNKGSGRHGKVCEGAVKLIQDEENAIQFKIEPLYQSDKREETEEEEEEPLGNIPQNDAHSGASTPTSTPSFSLTGTDSGEPVTIGLSSPSHAGVSLPPGFIYTGGAALPRQTLLLTRPTSQTPVSLSSGSPILRLARLPSGGVAVVRSPDGALRPITLAHNAKRFILHPHQYQGRGGGTAVALHRWPDASSMAQFAAGSNLVIRTGKAPSVPPHSSPSITSCITQSPVTTLIDSMAGNVITTSVQLSQQMQQQQHTVVAAVAKGTPTPGSSKGSTKRSGCRCGNAASQPSKLTCCGQRCICYVDGKSCVDCKCRGCNNPYLPAGGKKVMAIAAANQVQQIMSQPTSVSIATGISNAMHSLHTGSSPATISTFTLQPHQQSQQTGIQTVLSPQIFTTARVQGPPSSTGPGVASHQMSPSTATAFIPLANFTSNQFAQFTIPLPISLIQPANNPPQ